MPVHNQPSQLSSVLHNLNRTAVSLELAAAAPQSGVAGSGAGRERLLPPDPTPQLLLEAPSQGLHAFRTDRRLPKSRPRHFQHPSAVR